MKFKYRRRTDRISNNLTIVPATVHSILFMNAYVL